MPSKAYQRWLDERLPELEELRRAHAAVGGTGAGRRHQTLRVNHAYAVILSGAFQGFCRDLHSEAVDHLAAQVTAPSLGLMFQRQLTAKRYLDAGNPNPSNLQQDFGRLLPSAGAFWDMVYGNPPNAAIVKRREKLEELNTWRNAIAHQDWTKVGNTPNLQLNKVTEWRSACHMLARRFDSVIGTYLKSVTGRAPW